ncbi:PucR family transcriptional regulator ligand-binding domain-containing protein [Alkalihalobacillus trypoxylicola]|nr:PucR family transcriptional regulator ligand-binding domain-containing protein [Alkalihalobacillus trypoxylicola]
MDSAKRGLTIEGLLQLEPMSGSVVKAAHRNTNRVISRINIIGGPDILNWVRPGEFIVTNGYPFQDNPEAFADMIPQLQERNIAGIGIKVRRFLREIPESLLKNAEEVGFPVVEIPPDTTFSDIVRVAMEEIFFKESEHIMTLYDRVQFVSQELAKGQSIEEVIHQFEHRMGNPIIIYDLEGNIIAPLLEKIIDKDDLYQLVSQIERKTGIGLSKISLDSEDIYCFSTPLLNEYSKRHISFIACLETNYQLTEIDCLTIEKISDLLSMELTHLSAKKKIEQKYMEQFLSDLFMGEALTESDIHLRLTAFDLSLEHNFYQVLMIDQVSSNNDIYQYLKSFPSERDFLMIGTTFKGKLTLLLAADNCEKLKEQMVLIDQRVTKFHNSKKVNESHRIYVGSPVSVLLEISKSFKEASRVYHIMNKYQVTETLHKYENMHIYRLLYLLPENEEVAQYIDQFLQPLRDASINSIDYLKTLEVYFQANQNVKLTAKKMYTHYNTIVYRLAKIAELLDLDLKNPENLLELQIALKLERLKSGKG